MPSTKSPQDPDYNRFEKFFKLWRGVNKTTDVAAVPDNQVTEAINVRPTIDGYEERGGQTKWTTFPTSGTVEGMHEAGDIGAPSGVFQLPPYTGFPGGAITTLDGKLYFLWTLFNGTEATGMVLDIGSTGSARQQTLDNGTVQYAGLHGDSYKTGTSNIEFDVTSINTVGSLPLPTGSPASIGILSSICQTQTGVIYVYFETDDPTQDNVVYIFDPASGSFTADTSFTEASGNRHRGRLIAYGADKVLLCQGSSGTPTQAKIFLRKSDGTWVQIARPTVASFDCWGGAVEYGANVYFFGSPNVFDDAAPMANPNILVWDKNEVTLTMTVVADFRADVLGSVVLGAGSYLAAFGAASMGGNLYYGWNSWDGDINDPVDAALKGSYIGKFDGATWTHKWSTTTASVTALDLFTPRIRSGSLGFIVNSGTDFVMWSGGVHEFTSNLFGTAGFRVSFASAAVLETVEFIGPSPITGAHSSGGGVVLTP